VALAIRIGWRATFGVVLPPADAGVLDRLAKGTHYAVYLLLVAVVVLGIVNACYRGYELYGVLRLPQFGGADPGTQTRINWWHEWVANLTVLIAFCHAGAALGHQYVWRDHLLDRMRTSTTR
jgi:cytochrome b561